jgi:hypothetical protein
VHFKFTADVAFTVKTAAHSTAGNLHRPDHRHVIKETRWTRSNGDGAASATLRAIGIGLTVNTAAAPSTR